MHSHLRENLDVINQQIKAAAKRSHRQPETVKLIAVTKTHASDILQSAVEAGARIFGENKVQEAEGKIVELGRDNIEWHLIGHLQANKARKAVKLFDVIHTLDSVELAERLERICIEENRTELSVLAQVDLADEATKNGIKVENLSELIETVNGCKRLRLIGLMTIPPFFEDVEKVRPYFRKLREIRDEMLPNGELSMGMSHDFEIAVEEGATMVRVGTAIFGRRTVK